MILPPRSPNQHRPDRPRPPIDLTATGRPRPPGDLPALDRFAAPPWDRSSPQWIAIDDDLPADHLARVIDEAVDQLDLTPLFASYAGVGSRAHRPDLMLKIVLYEIQTGQRSPARWACDAGDRRCLMWLGLGGVPGRSRWYDFRDRLGPLLETFHRQVLGWALARGLTTAKAGSLDGTAVAASASRHRLVDLTRLQRRSAELDRVIAADRTRQDPGPIPGWMARFPATRRRQRHRFAEARRTSLKEHARNARRPADKRQEPEKIVISTGDFEAVSGRDKEKVFRPLYTTQVVQDLESPLVLAYEVFARATDAGTLMPSRERAHDLSGVWLERLLADSAYASALDLVDCKEAGVDLYAPYQENDRTGSSRRKKPPGQIPKSEFAWLPEEQTYVCPRGHRPKRIGREERDRAQERSVEIAIDRCPKEHCQVCPLARRCTRGANGRTIKRNEHEDLIVAHQAKMATAEAKAIYKRRGQTIELRYADAKTYRGLRRFSSRGLKRVRIEVGLMVLAHNLSVVLTNRRRKTTEGTDGTACQEAA
jgi:transposase